MDAEVRETQPKPGSHGRRSRQQPARILSELRGTANPSDTLIPDFWLPELRHNTFLL